MAAYTSKGFLNLIFASLLPFVFTFLWLYQNSQLPIEDASSFLLAASDIYHQFIEKGFWSGIEGLFNIRGWRPIFFQDLSVPFLILSQGNIYFAYASVALLCIVSSTIYLYLLLRLKLDPLSAIIGANLIGLLPLVQGQVTTFFAESALFPCIIACLYHLIHSQLLQNRKHTYLFILFLFLSMVIRPVEAVTNMMFVFILFLSEGWYRQVFKTNEILQGLLLCALGLLIFLLTCYLHYFSYHVVPLIDNAGPLDMRMGKTLQSVLRYLVMSIVLLGGWFVFKKVIHLKNPFKESREKSMLLPTIAITSALVLAWFLPFAFETFQWIYRTSLGDVAGTGSLIRPNTAVFSTISSYILAEGIVVVLGIMGMSMVAIIGLPLLTIKDVLLSRPFLYLIALLPFPLFEALYTIQTVPRKLSVAFPALLAAWLLLGLKKGRGWHIRLFLASGLLIFQIIWMSQIFFVKENQNLVKAPVTVKPNPHQVVLDFLNAQAKIYHLNNFIIEVDTRAVRPIDPFLLNAMVGITRPGYAATYPYFSFFSEKNPSILNDGTSAIFLTDRTADMLTSPQAAKKYAEKYQQEKDPSIKTFYEFLLHYSQNTLSVFGWKVGPCLSIISPTHENYRGCLLLAKS